MQVQTVPNPYTGPTRHYKVHVGDETHEIAGREKAIRRAKEASKRRGRARLEGEDTPVEIHFVRGQVSQYRFETRRNRRRRNS